MLTRLIFGRNELSLRQILARSSHWQWLATGLPSGVLLLAVAVAGAIFEIDIAKITRDPTSLGKIHPLSGFLSSLGVLLWSTAASICLFMALLARKRRAAEVFAFAICSALLSAYLTFDDLFLVHDNLLRLYLGLYDAWGYGFLGAATLAYLIRFRDFILRHTDFLFLAMAFGFLSMSVVIDLLSEYQYGLGYWQLFIEDGFKWLGIACWCSYYVRTCYQFVVEPDRFTPEAA